jgi:type II secretory pathway component PulF
MPVFAYRVLDAVEQASSGTLRADTPRAARDLLRTQGFRVLELEPVNHESRRSAVGWWRRPGRQQVVESLSDLATLLGVGVPLDESIGTLAKQSRGSLRKLWQQVLDDVASGRSLSDSLGEHPQTFDPLTIALVRVGENAGNLDEILHQLGKFQKRAASQQASLINALLYPLVILVVAVSVTIFLMTNVLPSLLENLADLGKELPWPTWVLQQVTNGLIGYWYLWIGILVATVGAWAWLLKNPHGRSLWDRTWLKMPFVGRLIVKQELSRVALVLSVLLKSGMDFLLAMDLAKAAAKNSCVRTALENCRLATQRGQDIGQALAVEPWIPAVVIQVVSVGQASGQLDELLGRLADDYDSQVAVMVGRLSALIEPVLIVILAVVIGFVVFATFLPILQSGDIS